MADRPTLVRQLKLLRQLSTSRRGCCVRDLAIENEVSERSIRRDLEALEIAGFQLGSAFGDDGLKYWRLEGGSGLPVPNLDIGETAALYLGRRFLEPLAGTALWEFAQSAIIKLRQHFNPDSLKYLESLASTVHETTFGGSDYSERADLIDGLMIGINESRITRLLYHPLSSETPKEYELQPLGLIWHRATLYLVASTVAQPEPRHFKVDRIRDASVLVETFTRPAEFDLEMHLQNCLGVYQTNAPLTEVRIRFSSEVARYVTEHRWHHSQQIEEQPDGSLVVVLQLSDLTEVKSWVLSFGANAEVLSPGSLLDSVKQELELSLAAYARSVLEPASEQDGCGGDQ